MGIESYFDTKEECDAFNVWAFGKDWRDLDPISGHFKRWNERHIDKLKLISSGDLKKDIPKMISIWEYGEIIEEVAPIEISKKGFIRKLVLKYFC